MEILQCSGNFATAEPGDPGLSKMSLAIDPEFKSCSLDPSRLLFHAQQLIPVYVADEVQRQMQIVVGDTPCGRFDREGHTGIVQLFT